MYTNWHPPHKTHTYGNDKGHTCRIALCGHSGMSGNRAIHFCGESLRLTNLSFNAHNARLLLAVRQAETFSSLRALPP